MSGSAFKTTLAALPGYDGGLSGSHMTVQSLLQAAN